MTCNRGRVGPHDVDLTIREAQIADVPQLAALMRQEINEPGVMARPRGSTPPPGGWQLSPSHHQMIRDDVTETDTLLLVAKIEARIVGKLSLGPGKNEERRRRTALAMYVAPAWRGRDLGSALLTRGIEWAREQPRLTAIHLAVFAELRRREEARGDRKLGIAEEHLATYKTAGPFDMEVDTRAATPEECAKQIIAAMAEPTAFQQIRAELERRKAEQSGGGDAEDRPSQL